MFTVPLTDFGCGNSAATAVPRNFLSREIAPISDAYEAVQVERTVQLADESRFVHVATVDQAARDHRELAFFGGKVTPP